MIPGDPAFPLKHMLARHRSIIGACHYDAITNPTGSKISSFMGTPAVARDYVELIERYGEWREAKALEAGLDLQEPSLKRLKWQRDNEPIRMWSLSYGTVIAATLAALQPHRVESLLLDGVVDTDDYYAGEWMLSVVDADAGMDSFFEYCARAGPKDCAFSSGYDSPQMLKARLEAIAEWLRASPYSVTETPTTSPEIITWSDLMNMIWRFNYLPLRKWPMLANALHSLDAAHNATGDAGLTFASLKQASNPLAAKADALAACPTVDAHDPACAPVGFDSRSAWRAVQCGDGNTDRMVSEDAFAAYFAAITRQSVWQGSSWAWLRFVCLGWRGRAVWKLSANIADVVSAKPIMFAGNTGDPVTPLRNAEAMAARFHSSGILRLDFDGHCSISMASLCGAKAIRAYFQRGQMPAADQPACLPTSRPLISVESARELGLVESHCGGLLQYERELLAAAEKLVDVFNALA